MKHLRSTVGSHVRLSNYTNGRLAVVIVGVYLALVFSTYLRDVFSCLIPPVTPWECSMPLFLATLVTSPTSALILAVLESIGEPGIAGMLAATVVGAILNSLALWFLLRGRARGARPPAGRAAGQ